MGVTERVDTIWSCKELNRMLWFRTTVDALFDMLHRSRRYGQIEECREALQLEDPLLARLAPWQEKRRNSKVGSLLF